jgi:DNA-binding NarL/FixJ family response regulator
VIVTHPALPCPSITPCTSPPERAARCRAFSACWPKTSPTQRELEVALMICEGLPDKVIAHRLGVEPSTVRTYLKRIFEKVGVHRRSGAAAMFGRPR